MASSARSSPADLVLEATKDSIARTRRVVFVLLTLLGIGVFHLFLWNASWEKARIAARRGVAARIEEMNGNCKVCSSTEESKETIKVMRKQADDLELQRTNQLFELPLVALKVTSSDFSVAVLMAAIATLLCLLFYQRRLFTCLKRLRELSGSEVVAALLEYNFTLIGSRATRLTRAGTAVVLFGLPLLAIAFIFSDAYDLWGFYTDPTRKLAFSYPGFMHWVWARIGILLVLAFVLSVLGMRCRREIRASEEALMPKGDALGLLPF